MRNRNYDETNKEFFIAIDHGLSFQNIEGLERPLNILNIISSNDKITGTIASFGVYRQAQKMNIDLKNKTRLLTVDYVEINENDLSNREIIIEPSETASVNPSGFKMFLNMYDDTEKLIHNIRDFERFVTYGINNNISSLAEVMFYNNKAFTDKKTQRRELMKACRLAMELGADALKIPIIDDIDVIDEIFESFKLPIYLLGGKKYDDQNDFIKHIQILCNKPISGLMFGRNVWQAEDISGMIEDITKIISI